MLLIIADRVDLENLQVRYTISKCFLDETLSILETLR